MATNQNGKLLDTAGNIAVDFVWGNFPLQPNDIRRDNGGTNLDYTLDSHNIAEDGWNGYPLYTPNTTGTQSGGVDYVKVPNVVEKLLADARDIIVDSELVVGTTTTTTVGYIASPSNAGLVKTQSVTAATSVAVGTVVNLVTFSAT
jgi:hypothetical protein